MDTRDRYAFELGWRLVGMTLTALTSLPGLAAGFLWSRDWTRAFRELRHAEQVARRLIIAEAGRLIAEGEVALTRPFLTSADTCAGRYPWKKGAIRPDPQPANAPVHGRLPAQGPAESGWHAVVASQPSFSLFEPLPDPLRLAGLIETDARERLAGLAPSMQMPKETRGLSRRIAALQAVFDDHVPAARRMARFLLRGRARRSCALPPGNPPAFRLRQFLDWPMDVLMQAHEAALRVLNRGWDPPF